MNSKHDQLETLKEIRALMERSSLFLSLSGLSGIIAGLTAIIGVLIAYNYLGNGLLSPVNYSHLALKSNLSDVYTFLLWDAFIVLAVAISGATFLSKRKAEKAKIPFWDATARRLVINMAIPLIAGGIYSAILFQHGYIELIVPSTLIFYGLALLNASKYTFTEIRFLGILQIILGLGASIYVEYGLLFWGFGFGILHIIYGSTMYIRYEK